MGDAIVRPVVVQQMLQNRAPKGWGQATRDSKIRQCAKQKKERKRERERECVCVCVREFTHTHTQMYTPG